MRTRKKSMLAVLIFAAFAWLAGTAEAGKEPTLQPSPGIPEAKQTTRGLYVTAQEAYEKWRADPDNVTILDVRTPEEFIFVGHPAMAWNVPFAVQTYEWDPGKQYFTMQPDPAFVSRVKALFKPDNTLLAMCRSGDRSAMAADVLTAAGFTNVYTVVDGMEGDTVDDAGSWYIGKRMKNGWKNSGLPWTYEIDPKRMRLPISN